MAGSNSGVRRGGLLEALGSFDVAVDGAGLDALAVVIVERGRAVAELVVCVEQPAVVLVALQAIILLRAGNAVLHAGNTLVDVKVVDCLDEVSEE